LGEKDLGIWCALYYIVVAGNTVVAALGQSAGPRLSKYYAADNKKAFTDLLRLLVGAGIVLGVLGWSVATAFGNQLLTLVYRPDYAQHARLLTWLVITAGLGYTYVFVGSAVTAMRNFRIQLPIHILSFFVTLVLSWSLIRRYGLMGASWAMLGDNIFELLMYTAFIAATLRKWKPSSIGEILER
jgi:O-antigen/teichoic acid export membrane protein